MCIQSIFALAFFLHLPIDYEKVTSKYDSTVTFVSVSANQSSQLIGLISEDPVYEGKR